MMKPHKHADILRALANGHEIEWKPCTSQGPWNALLAAHAIVHLVDGETSVIDYRIKPEKKWFRVAEYKEEGCKGVGIVASEKDELGASKDKHFYRWITDRIYYE